MDYRTKKQKANFDANHANKPFNLTQDQIDMLPDEVPESPIKLTPAVWDVHSVGCSARSYNPGPPMPLASNSASHNERLIRD